MLPDGAELQMLHQACQVLNCPFLMPGLSLHPLLQAVPDSTKPPLLCIHGAYHAAW